MAFFALGALEWAQLCHYRRWFTKSLYVGCFVLISGLAGWIGSRYILWLANIFWLLPLGWLYLFRGKAPYLLRTNHRRALIGLFYLTFAWYSLYSLHRWFGPVWIIFLFILVWSTDTFAYFVGKKYGRVPLAPQLSPNKTQEGFWGGVIGAFLLGLFSFGIVHSSWLMTKALPLWLGVSIITILLAVLGDLFESMIKRISEVKDSGKLLPGHGGVLDRIDSLIAALPFYALSLQWVIGG